ncbi:hypothetical protein RCH33_561 [Flavobacterium daejeonense]|nr:hypothetical protein RCH33_561 [Flavobacterium daejeonense]
MKKNKTNPNNEIDTTLEQLIISLIHQGVTLNELIKPTENIVDPKEREEAKTTVTNIVLDFINKNPEYIYLINDNFNSNEFLNSLGFDILNFDF